MLVRKLKCLNKTQSLVDITADREIIDRHLTQDTFVINDEKATEGNAVILFQDVVSLINTRSGIVERFHEIFCQMCELIVFTLATAWVGSAKRGI